MSLHIYLKTHPRVLTQFLLRNLIYQLSQELSCHSTRTVTIRLFTLNLVLKSFIHQPTLARFGTIKIQMSLPNNFIPHKVAVCDDKDPPWFNGKIKSLFNEKLGTYNAYLKNSDNIKLLNNLRSLQQRLPNLIDDSKQKYFIRLSQNLTTILESTKVYWALLKFS